MRSFSRYVLLLATTFVLVAALSVWNVRRHSRLRASEILTRTHRADLEMRYQALSTVTAMYGGRTVESQARLVRAPRKLSIIYLSGDRKGLQSGYNERWFWRKDRDAPMQAYAEVKVRPDEMAARRFQLMMKNYRGYWRGEDIVNGRAADIVEVRPKIYVDGARGPLKRIWVDRETGLSLRTDTLNYQQQPVMKIVLSKIELQPQINAATFATPDQMMQVAGKAGWTAEELGDDRDGVARRTGIRIATPTYLPPGFEFDAVGVHHCEQGIAGKPVALVRYIDGVNTLTIFAMPPKASTLKSLTETRGSCDFGPGTMIMAQKNGLQLMAVADLPPATLQRVLDSTGVQKN